MKNLRVRVSLVLLVCICLFYTLAAAQTWAPTATQAIGPALANAIDQGSLPNSTPIHVNVALQIQNRAALLAYVQSITNPGKFAIRSRNCSPPTSSRIMLPPARKCNQS